MAVIRRACLILLLLTLSRGARADGPVTDRNYAIDAYHGATVSDYRVIGMGGVSLATAEGATGLLANAAAAASRPATSTSWFDWDWLLDVYSPGLGVDADNSGISQERMIGKSGAFNLGLVGMFGAWGTAVTITGQVRDFSFPSGTQASLSAAMGRLTLARSFSDGEWVAGASLLVGGFTLKTPTSGTDLVNTANWSVEAGALWRPHGENARVGLSFRPRILARIDALRDDPRPPGSEKLSGQERYRVRQGDYRIVYAVLDAELIVEIVKFFRTKQPPVAQQETLEIYAFMEAADESKRRGGEPVELEEMMTKAKPLAAKRLAELGVK